MIKCFNGFFLGPAKPEHCSTWKAVSPPPWLRKHLLMTISHGKTRNPTLFMRTIRGCTSQIHSKDFSAFDRFQAIQNPLVTALDRTSSRSEQPWNPSPRPTSTRHDAGVQGHQTLTAVPRRFSQSIQGIDQRRGTIRQHRRNDVGTPLEQMSKSCPTEAQWF